MEEPGHPNSYFPLVGGTDFVFAKVNSLVVHSDLLDLFLDLFLMRESLFESLFKLSPGSV